MSVGALGAITFRSGLYAYVGSAQNNLQKRVNRHLGKKKRIFWHIDYLLDNGAAKVVQVYYRQADRTEECRIARLIGGRGELVNGFGSSDCNCKSHLFGIEDCGFLSKSMHTLGMTHD